MLRDEVPWLAHFAAGTKTEKKVSSLGATSNQPAERDDPSSHGI